MESRPTDIVSNVACPALRRTLSTATATATGKPKINIRERVLYDVLDGVQESIDHGGHRVRVRHCGYLHEELLAPDLRF